LHRRVHFLQPLLLKQIEPEKFSRKCKGNRGFRCYKKDDPKIAKMTFGKMKPCIRYTRSCGLKGNAVSNIRAKIEA